MKLNDTLTIEKLKNEAMPLVEAMKNGKSAKEIACEIYCSLDGKTEAIANLMVEDMTDTIEAYHKEVDRCIENDEEYITSKLDEQVKDVDDPGKRCEIYHRIIVAAGAQAILSDGESDAQSRAEAFIKENSGAAFSEDNINEEEAILRQTAADALKNSSLTVFELSEILGDLEGIKGGFSYGRESKDIKLIISMQAYVNALKGEYEDYTENVSMEQLVYGVCGAVDTCAAAAMMGAAKGDPAKENLAIKILRAVGLVVGLLMVLYVTALIFSGICTLLVGYTALSLMVCKTIAFAATLAIMLITNYDDAIEEGISDLFATFGYIIGYGANAMLNGVKKLIEISAPVVRKSLTWVKTTLVTVLSKFFGRPGPAGACMTAESLVDDTEASDETEETEQDSEQAPALA